MVFSSLPFLFGYLALTLAIYFIAPLRWRNLLLLLVSLFFYDIDHVADANEIMEEAQLVYKGMRSNFIKQRTEEIVEAINSMEYSYLALTDKEKAELFQFVPDDNNYNLEVHMAVLKACGLKLDFDEVYEDYQKIYDKTMEMQGDKKNERGESGRGRAR